jgi:NADH-quinone oxidoreductase subunit E
MSVRRLAPKEIQPASFSFTPENLAWAKQQIAKYPEGRQASAAIAILWRVQEQHEGWISEPAIRAVADLLDMPYIRVLELATFYTMFQLQPVGKKAHVQVCGTTPCRLRGAADLIEVCQSRIHREPFHVSKDGSFSWEEVECLGACVNAPMVLIGKDTYEDLTKERFGKVLDGFASGRPPKPGPQIDRQFSAPVGGPTTLKEAT